MNARQKAKVYKRKYIALMNRFVKLHRVELPMQQHKIDTIRFERFLKDEDYLRNIIAKDIADRLIDDVGKYIDFNIEFCPHLNKYRVYWEIKVVNKEEK